MNKYLRFDDLHEFWNFAFRESTAFTKSSRQFASDWNGGVSWEQAKILATNGWIDGLEEIQKINVELTEIIANKIERRLPEYSVAGGVVDVGEYLCSSPEYFIKPIPAEYNDQGKIIKIVCSISFSASISDKVIIQRGAMVCALADALEMSGYRCEIIINDATYYGLSSIEIDICLKKANQSLNIIEAAFCLAHPAMLRRFIFSAQELEGWSDLVYHYGYPKAAKDKGDLYINEIFSREVPNSQAIEWVVSQLETLGVTINNI